MPKAQARPSKDPAKTPAQPVAAQPARDPKQDQLGNNAVNAQQQAKEKGALPPGFNAAAMAERIHAALDGWGTDERALLDVLYTGRQDLTRAIEAEYNRRYSPGLSQALQAELSGDTLTKALTLLKKGDLSLADKIREGASGWGTDEDRIFNALERASAEELAQAKADTGVMAILQSDLSDEDFQLAQAYLSGKNALASKLRRAIRGWGTDEAALWRELGAASAEEKAFVLAQPALMEALSDDLSGDDLTRLKKMLNGNFDNADRITMALAGWGSDVAALQLALGGLTQTEYARLPQDIDALLVDELSGADLLLAQDALHQKRLSFDSAYKAAYLDQHGDKLKEEGATVLLAQGDAANSLVARLIAACTGLGTKDQKIWSILTEMRAPEREFIRTHNPQGVLDILRDDLGKRDYQRVMTLLGGGASSAVPALREAMNRWGTDEELVYSALDRVVKEGHSAEILADRDMMLTLRDDLGGEQYAVALRVLTNGRFTADDRLAWATGQFGTHEDLIFHLCTEYGSQWHSGGEVKTSIKDLLQSELSTADYWRAMDLIRGEPKGEAERLARSKEMLERQRSGVSDALMDSLSATGENADDAWREYQASFNQAHEDGKVTEEEVQGLRQDEAFSQRLTAEHAQAKAVTAQWASTIAVALVGVAATLLTGGAAGPMILGFGGKIAALGEMMVLSAVTKVGMNKAILGEGYDLASAETLTEAVGAMLEVGVGAMGTGLSVSLVGKLSKTGIGKTVAAAVVDRFGDVGKRILAEGLTQAIESGIEDSVKGSLQLILQEKTWEAELEDAFANISSTAFTKGLGGMGKGFARGVASKSLTEVFKPKVQEWLKKRKEGKAEDAQTPQQLGKDHYPEDGDDIEVEKTIRRNQEDDLPGLRPNHEGTPYKDVENGKAFLYGEGGIPWTSTPTTSSRAPWGTATSWPAWPPRPGPTPTPSAT